MTDAWRRRAKCAVIGLYEVINSGKHSRSVIIGEPINSNGVKRICWSVLIMFIVDKEEQLARRVEELLLSSYKIGGKAGNGTKPKKFLISLSSAWQLFNSYVCSNLVCPAHPNLFSQKSGKCTQELPIDFSKRSRNSGCLPFPVSVTLPTGTDKNQRRGIRPNDPGEWERFQRNSRAIWKTVEISPYQNEDVPWQYSSHSIDELIVSFDFVIMALIEVIRHSTLGIATCPTDLHSSGRT